MINKSYLERENISEIKRGLSKNGIIVLNDFLLNKEYKKIKKNVLNLKYKNEINLMEYKFSSAEFELSENVKEFLLNIFGLPAREIKAYSLGHKDYWLLQDKRNHEFILDLTNNWNPGFGGVICYRDDDGNAIKIPCSENSLVIVKNKKLKRYINYINHYARKRKRYFVLGRFAKDL